MGISCFTIIPMYAWSGFIDKHLADPSPPEVWDLCPRYRDYPLILLA